MYIKMALVLAFTITTLSLVATPGFGQCSNSNGGGNCQSNSGQIPAGGYDNFTNVGGSVFTQPQTFNPPFGPLPAVNGGPYTGPAIGGLPSAETGDFDLSNGEGNVVLSGQSFDVVVEHPGGDADIKVRTFSLRAEADQFVGQLSQRFWVAFSDTSNKRGYREAKSAVEIAGIADSIRASGDQFRGAFPVIARVALPEATSLESLLESEHGVTEIPAAKQVLENESRSQETQLPLADSQLIAIEGLWAAVARTSNGELRKIELKLDSGGWASLTIPDGTGKPTTIERRAIIEDGQLKLRDGEQEMLLGSLTQVKSDQFVLTRDGGQITFIKR